MPTNGKSHPDKSEIQAVAFCPQCKRGVFAVFKDGEWRGVEGDTTILLQLKVQRHHTLCPECAEGGQEFVL